MTTRRHFLKTTALGAAYLAWLGLSLWRAPPDSAAASAGNGAGGTSSFMAGLLVTLADQKAILFYLGFFPAFVDLQRIAPLDVAIIIAVTIVAVGGVTSSISATAEVETGPSVPRWASYTAFR